MAMLLSIPAAKNSNELHKGSKGRDKNKVIITVTPSINIPDEKSLQIEYLVQQIFSRDLVRNSSKTIHNNIANHYSALFVQRLERIEWVNHHSHS